MKTGKSKTHKCIECEIIPCVNLYKKDGGLEGGELYVLEKCLNSKKYVPCECGSVIRTLCLLLQEFSDRLSSELYHQCISDLKSTVFLISTGHYRTAIQTLRPVIENWLVGLYWDCKFMTYPKKEVVIQEFEKFKIEVDYEVPKEEWIEVLGEKIDCKGKRRKRYFNQEFLSGWLLKREIIDGKSKNEINQISRKLNKYLHPSFPKTDIGRNCFTGCPASVKFNRKEYARCVELFQDTTIHIIRTFYQYLKISSPDKINSENVKEAFDHILALQEVEKDIGRKLVISEGFRRFINDIEAAESNTT